MARAAQVRPITHLNSHDFHSQNFQSLFFKFAGTEQQIKHDVGETGRIVSANGGNKLVFARNDKEKDDLWRARKVALWR